MRYFIEYPCSVDADGRSWVDPEHMTAFAQAAERAGVDALALTEHPAPSRQWMDRGGHDAIDAFTGLSFFAAVTTKIQVMTYLTVVPYHNPFALAKAMASLDILSRGRARFTLGSGYMHSEFEALGVDFAVRGELFDEGMEVVRGLFESPHKFVHEGKHFKASDVTLSPGPIQTPRPPLWLGGNSKLVRERVAKWGDGWAPLTIAGPELSKLAHTAAVLSDEHFAQQVKELKQAIADNGRDPDSVEISAIGTKPPAPDASFAERLDHVTGLAEIGVTWTSIAVDGSSTSKALEDIAAFGENVIAHSR